MRNTLAAAGGGGKSTELHPKLLLVQKKKAEAGVRADLRSAGFGFSV